MTDAAQAPKPTDEALATHRLFSTADGQVLLTHLRASTLERVLGPNATDAELRDHAGQCRVVKKIEMMMKNGGQDL